MTSARRVKSSRRGNSLWPLDLALVLLGGLVMFLVMRLLSFEATDPFKNAWTYVLGVPTVLVAVSMLTHVLSNETVERSIQIGFLLSVSLHLLLAFAAVNLVLFGGFWNSTQTEVKREATRSVKQSPKYLETSVPSQESAKLEYLKAPKEPRENPKEVDNEAIRESKAAVVTMVDSRVAIDAKIDERSYPEEKKQESIPLPTIASSAKKLDRPKISPLQNVSQSSIDVPNLPNLNRSELGDLTANDAALDNSKRKDSSLESISSPRPAPDLNVQPSKSSVIDLGRAMVQQQEINRQIDQALKEQRVELDSPSLTSQISNRPAASTDSVDSPVVPVPELSQSAGNANPNRDLANLSSVAESGERTMQNRPTRESDIAALSLVVGPQMDLIPRAAPTNGLGRTKAASEMEMDGRLDFLSGRGEPSAVSRSEVRSGEQGAPIKGGVPFSSATGAPIASSPVPMADISSGSSASESVSDRVSPAMADIALQSALRERTESQGTGESAARGNPSKVLSAIQPADLSGPRDDLISRGLGMREMESPLPDLRLSDFAPDRLKRPDLSGPQSASASVPIPTPAFLQRLKRMEEREGEAASQLGPLGPQTELAIERGLQFLAKYQRPDGSWYLEDFNEPVRMRSPTAATALALLSFQGAGYTHQQFKYESVCKGAVGWLIKQQRPNGDLYVRTDNISNANAWLYSHAMATLALCEAYGMTQDEAVRGAAQHAVDFLVESQDPVAGGWRYSPRIGSDTSVTGWVMMALKSAELSGLRVPGSTYVGLQKWIENSQAKDSPYLYRYNWLANTPSTEHGRIPTPVMTSVGLLIRLYTGWKRDNEQMQKGVAWLLERLPAEGTRQAPARDTYYWYYATQVIFHAGGESWKRWYGALYPMLIRTQVESGDYIGSWDPGGPVPDAWGAFGGRLYVTTLNLLSLEVYYRHLPLYDATAE